MAVAAPRYVSLCPSLTETLFELGVGASVVGATKFCVHPAAGVEHVVRVGGTKDPRLDRIADLSPTIVFANEEENRLEDVEALRGRGLRVETSFPRRVDDVAPMIRELGRAVDRDERAEWLAARVEGAAAGVRAQAALGARRRFLVLIWRGPWMGAAGGTYLSDLLSAAGGTNMLEGERVRYPQLTLERVRELDPEVVLLPSEPFPFRARHVEELAGATGWAHGRFLRCNGEWLTWHGTRTAQALVECSRWLGFPGATSR